VPGHILWRRLELLGPYEHLRGLHSASHYTDLPMGQTTDLVSEKKEDNS
jgi:hypothetical protein